MKKQEEEFKLKEKIDYLGDNFGFPIKAVKEFIRLLKERVSQSSITNDETNEILEEIDKLSGGLWNEKAI